MTGALVEPAAAIVRLARAPVPVVRDSPKTGTAVTDTLMLLGVVVAIPFAMMLFGLPIALVLRLLLRLAKLV